MGLLHGECDAKADGFVPRGAWPHNCMTGHGPDADTFAKACSLDTRQPTVITDTMAFMFETPAIVCPMSRPSGHATFTVHRRAI